MQCVCVCVCVCVYFFIMQLCLLQYGSVFKVVIKGRDYVFNAASGAKRVSY